MTSSALINIRSLRLLIAAVEEKLQRTQWRRELAGHRPALKRRRDFLRARLDEVLEEAVE